MSIKPPKDTCYACDQPATTKEHAPPYSFFPKGKRQNLITVPSCSVHNCDNAPDVEYVRNAIAFHAGSERNWRIVDRHGEEIIR
jgi:hypothetical protein